jgi:hypothetical protein
MGILYDSPQHSPQVGTLGATSNVVGNHQRLRMAEGIISPKII